MTKATFWKQLIGSTVLSLLLGGIANYFLDGKGDWTLLFLSVGFFIALSILLFFAGQRAMASKSPYSFIRLIIINVFGKILLCFGLVAVYFKATQPETKYFVIPFLITYLIFMIFETNFLSIQSRTK